MPEIYDQSRVIRLTEFTEHKFACVISNILQLSFLGMKMNLFT